MAAIALSHIKGKPLSQHEFNVAYLLSQGIYSGEVARRLKRSQYSINGTRKRVYAKLDISNLDELAKWAEKEGI